MQFRREGVRVAALLVAMIAAGCGGGSGDPGQTAQTGQTNILTGGTFKPDSGTTGPSNPAPGNDTSQPDPSQPDPSQPDPEPQPDPVPPPPDPVVRCMTIAQCIDTSRASVATFKGGKKAAASYTFDDGYDTSFEIADLFEARGLRASFYIVAGNVPEPEWAAWKNLVQRGHEVGNHTMTHTIDLGMPDVTDAQIKTEILDAQRLIETKMAVSGKPMVFAFPWHSSTAATRAFALQTHLAIRTSTPDMPFTLAFFDQDHGTPQETMATVNGQLADTVAAGGWYVAGGHGVDGDGWSPVTMQFLKDHLDYARGFNSQLWTDTYLNVARYQICRKQATLEVESASSTQVKLKLSGTFNPACTEPLTVKIPTVVSGTLGLVARDANGAEFPVKRNGGALTVDVVPGQTVTLVANQ